MKTTTITIKDIHCENCENTIRTALSRLPGVVRVVPSSERNDVTVSYDDAQIDEAALREKLLAVGYEPTS